MTYISKLAKNGKMQYFRVDADGKKKMIKRGEYEANMPDNGQARLDDMEPATSVEEPAATFAEIEIGSELPASPEPEYTPEPIPARPASKEATTIENPFDFVKNAVSEATGRYKLTYKVWKNYGSIYYRSCAICGFVLDNNGNVAAARFMGTTLESRKTVTEREVKAETDWQYITETVLRQISFVNEWWNPSEKSEKSA